MSSHLRRVPVPLYVIVWGIVFAVACVLYLARPLAPSEEARSLLLGVIGGLIVWLLTYWFDIGTLKKLQAYRDLGIVGLPAHRHDVEYYRRVVLRASEYVYVTGSSCSRFVEDFLNREAGEHPLIDMMMKDRALKVRLLVPDARHMDDVSANQFKNTLPRIAALRSEFPGQFDVRYFNRKASLSFVLTERDFVGGPISSRGRSKFAPALHVEARTVYAKHHRDHFYDVWESACEDYEGSHRSVRESSPRPALPTQ